MPSGRSDICVDELPYTARTGHRYCLFGQQQIRLSVFACCIDEELSSSASSFLILLACSLITFVAAAPVLSLADIEQQWAKGRQRSVAYFSSMPSSQSPCTRNTPRSSPLRPSCTFHPYNARLTDYDHRPKSTLHILVETPHQLGPFFGPEQAVVMSSNLRRRWMAGPERCMAAGGRVPMVGDAKPLAERGAIVTRTIGAWHMRTGPSHHQSNAGTCPPCHDAYALSAGSRRSPRALLHRAADRRCYRARNLLSTTWSWQRAGYSPSLLCVDLSFAVCSPRLTFTNHQELREIIYREILHPDANRIQLDDEYATYSYHDALVLFRLNKQIYLESRKVFRDLNIFVRIETPWSEAQQHAWNQGQVPIIVHGEQSSKFDKHFLTASIDAANFPLEREDEKPFIILLEDLGKFTKSWQYTTLSHSMLNPNLRLTLKLRDPYAPDWEEKKISKALQRKLLMPFGIVKDLSSVVFGGDPKPYPSIENELREAMRVPYPSPEQCLRDTIRFKLQGNDELKAGRYEAALQCYKEAWLAMHIVVTNTRRYIHADAHFNVELREAPFTGKNGQSERLILRVQLVANTCQVYLKLRDFEQCAFWGMRSISMLREAMGADGRHDIPAEDEAIVGFPAAVEMGKVYYRTAIAKKELGERGEARKLLRVAAIYLPRDELVRKEIAAMALPLG
nr:hypothetical protein CFP56_07608 [Quercus suber]